MSMPGMLTEEFSLPPMADGLKNSSTGDMSNYSVKYIKADIDDVGDVMMLQEIETRGIRGTDVILLSREKHTFLAQYFIVLQYLERNN